LLLRMRLVERVSFAVNVPLEKAVGVGALIIG
jgi:hypothetical protein